MTPLALQPIYTLVIKDQMPRMMTVMMMYRLYFVLQFSIGSVTATCEHTYSSKTGIRGNFSSPGYPSNYPLHTLCRYIFQGTLDERIKISFIEFDLEPGTKAGCLFDYIDIFTVDVEQMKNLEDRLCGGSVPGPFISSHHRVELSFKSDYAAARKGFLGEYEFIDEHWQPFPPRSAGCGNDFLTGDGGDITSPGYPLPYPPESQCTWTIRVDYDMKIVLNFIELDLGYSENCGSTYIAIYNGFASPSKRPADKICKIRGGREFKSKSFRVVVRFASGTANEYAWKGFRIAWTAVWVPKETQDEKGNYIEEECLGFHCKGGEYCIDTSGLLCNPLQRYCIAKSLRCNNVPNCGAFDHSDEEGCLTKMLALSTTVAGVIFGIILSLTTAMFICRRKRRRTAEMLYAEKQLQQLQKSDSSSLPGNLGRSPSIRRQGSVYSVGRRVYNSSSPVAANRAAVECDDEAEEQSGTETCFRYNGSISGSNFRASIRSYGRQTDPAGRNMRQSPEGSSRLLLEQEIVEPDAGVNLSPCRSVIAQRWGGVIYSNEPLTQPFPQQQQQQQQQQQLILQQYLQYQADDRLSRDLNAGQRFRSPSPDLRPHPVMEQRRYSGASLRYKKTDSSGGYVQLVPVVVGKNIQSTTSIV